MSSILFSIYIYAIFIKRVGKVGKAHMYWADKLISW